MTNTNETVTYEVRTQADPATGDLILPLPAELLASLGWNTGDEIDFSIDTGGRIVLRRVGRS